MTVTPVVCLKFKPTKCQKGPFYIVAPCLKSISMIQGTWNASWKLNSLKNNPPNCNIIPFDLSSQATDSEEAEQKNGDLILRPIHSSFFKKGYKPNLEVKE